MFQWTGYMYTCINAVHYLSTTSSFVFHNIHDGKKNNEMEWNDKISSKSFKIGNGINCSFSTQRSRESKISITGGFYDIQ